MQLVAEAMGIEASDAYLGWRKGGAPDLAAIERAGEAHYQDAHRTRAAQAVSVARFRLIIPRRR